MKIQCPGCDFSAEVPDERIPKEGTTATCPTCKTKFSVNRESEFTFSDKTNEPMMACPNCGINQVVSDNCTNCGIIFSKYISSQVNKPRVEERQAEAPAAKPYARTSIKQVLNIIGSILLIGVIASMVGGSIGFFIAVVFLGMITGSIANKKGHSFAKWWFYGAALFIVALPMAIMLKPTEAANNAAAWGGLRKCPKCAEMIQPEVQICRFCHADVTPISVTEQKQNKATAEKDNYVPGWLVAVVFAGIAIIIYVMANDKGSTTTSSPSQSIGNNVTNTPKVEPIKKEEQTYASKEDTVKATDNGPKKQESLRVQPASETAKSDNATVKSINKYVQDLEKNMDEEMRRSDERIRNNTINSLNKMVMLDDKHAASMRIHMAKGSLSKAEFDNIINDMCRSGSKTLIESKDYLTDSEYLYYKSKFCSPK